MRTWSSSGAVVFALLSARVGATVLAPAGLDEISRAAGAIVRARVAAVDARWTDGRRAIETVVTLDVEASLKGPHVPVVRFLVPGGTLGRYRSIVVGAPEFSVGQRVVVFLRQRAPEYSRVVGFSQGVFRIMEAGTGTGPVVIPPLITSPSTGAARIVRGDVARQAVPLAVFEQQLRSMVEGQR